MGTDPPFNMIINGQPDGYEVELARRFALSIDRPLDIAVMDFGAILRGICRNIKIQHQDSGSCLVLILD